jgi:ribosomal protein S18 acetylase RimI-like enzyme
MSFEIRAMEMADYDAVMALWQRCDGVGLSDADSRDSIRSYLERNPGMSYVAQSGGVLAGAVLAGHDGRRGYLHHLAVDPSVRRQGVATRLVDAALEALQRAGMRKCHLFLFNANESGLSFWKAVGWEPRNDIGIVSKNIGGCDSKSPC